MSSQVGAYVVFGYTFVGLSLWLGVWRGLLVRVRRQARLDAAHSGGRVVSGVRVGDAAVACVAGMAAGSVWPVWVLCATLYVVSVRPSVDERLARTENDDAR